jgi:hypothetical protein
MLVGAFSPSDWTDPKLKAVLADAGNSARSERERVFRWFRDPRSPDRKGSLLPPFYGDGDKFPNEGSYDLSLTPRQYECMRLWAKGKFDSGGRYPTPLNETEALDRAPLEECVGGPFGPGVELPWILRQSRMWIAPFRLKVLPEGAPVRDDYGDLLLPKACFRSRGPLDGAGPGTLTRWMGVPWQADAAACPAGNETPKHFLPLPSFWASRVPNWVLTEQAYHLALDGRLGEIRRIMHFNRRHAWWRDIDQGFSARINNNVKQWGRLGIVAPKHGEPPFPSRIWVETGRGGYDEANDPTVQQARIAERVADPPE